MTARDAILGRIRRGLGGVDADRRRVVAERLASPPKGVVPARGHVAPVEQIALFRRQAEKAEATVAEVVNAAAAPGAIADYLSAAALPPTLRMGADPRLAALAWPAFAVTTGPSSGDDHVGVSYAMAGVAETGTIVLVSGPDNPTTLNFLPDTHIVLVDAADIVADLETVWSRLRAAYGKDHMPRTVNMVTGPSRSADIEQTLVVGAHGPRRLHIVIVGRQD